MSKERQGGHERHNQSKPNQPEQQPHGGGVNKQELHPPKERPLPFEPNLSNHEQQRANLDPEVEKLIRAYAASEAEGDLKKEKRLLKRYLKDPSFIKIMTDFKLHGPVSLAYGPHTSDLGSRKED